MAEATAAGEAAYEVAAYDLALCHAILGRALKRSGEAQAALGPLDEARARFQRLADAGNRGAARMASVCLTERADALTALGRLDEAAAAYEEAIELDEQRGDPRDAAAGRFQLGTVRLLQRRYPEALQAYDEARQTFERLGEPDSVATAWHQMGMVFRYAEQYDTAETAYLNARRIRSTWETGRARQPRWASSATSTTAWAGSRTPSAFIARPPRSTPIPRLVTCTWRG